ncbi:MAG: polynucleotide kinase-phosphatase [Acidobacteriota bacterium]
MNLKVPAFSVVALIGASGSGKSTFAKKHFRATEVLSSDRFRGLVADDENDQAATADAFDALYYLAEKRLARRRLTVFDATNVQRDSRKKILTLARQYHCLAVAVVLKIDPKICHERNQGRPDRAFGRHVVRNQSLQLRKSLRSLKREGFRFVHVLSTPEEVAEATFERQPLWTDRRNEKGPFDLIGDVHGCHDELLALLDALGWRVSFDDGPNGKHYELNHPEGRKLVFVGDLVDRGPHTPEVLRLAMDAVDAGRAICVPGNHDVKLLKALRGAKVQLKHGLDLSLQQLDDERPEFRERVVEFLRSLISHYELDDGRLVVAHAGMREDMQGRASGAVRAFALYGETTGETDEFGSPVRHDWAREYRGSATVVYGHTPVPEPEWLNGTLNIDTGCVYGGRLTALRYPEREVVSVPAHQTYCEPRRPLAAPGEGEQSAQHAHDRQLFLEDVAGRRIISTRLRGNLTISEEHSAAALEVMSRFAADPRWLIYLPPTMAPTKTSREHGLLEHPAEAFGYYRRLGIERVICEEKHMGSRAVVVVCRDADAATERFGVATGETGICFTRTGRRFFADPELEIQLLDAVRSAATSARIWEELESEWLVLDCELMPWSVKAQELLRGQYAPVGTTGGMSLTFGAELARRNANPLIDLTGLAASLEERRENLGRYQVAYRRYCWPVDSLDQIRLAPFHLLASEQGVHRDRDHLWHLDMSERMVEADQGLLMSTAHRTVDLTDDGSRGAATDWWTELTEAGGEGMVVKPLDFVATGRKGLIQPALKCRGREYLRIIYGPEYTEPQHLQRLRSRGVSRKRSLALREFALGMEALDRFVAMEPLRRVHECVFAVLALESEPVDPRL